ncbi:zinc finger BED domain-containing protein 5 [Trichonephila clavipes]|nr:zinc finger BED domain-containing protein 5 [Trichonephila clavipes]
MDKFLNRTRIFDDNKASTSAQTSIVPKIKSRKYSQEYLNFGFTITDVNGEEKPLCVICSKILAADSMKPNKLKRHFETLQARCQNPRTIAEELILPVAIEIVETMFGDNFAKELQSVRLSNDTVSRRIDDIAEDVEQQFFGKLRDKLFSIQLDEATDSNKGAHFIAYVRFWDDGDRFNSCQVIYSQFGLAIHQNDHQARRRFVEWAQNEIAVVPDFHKRILFRDEAHFWLNGYVNKQNCRICSESNPQVYVEKPLHPETLTVWCALWAGGILLQKR